MRELHKTEVLKLLHYQLTEDASLADFLTAVIFLVLVFASFTVKVILKICTIFLFKILCWQNWETVVIHQRMIISERVAETTEKYNVR